MTSKELENSLSKVLNTHGYGFQSAIWQEIKLQRKYGSKWLFQASELPVKINDSETKIDIILRNQDTSHFIIGECKRVNPSMGNWCFIKTNPYKRNVKDFHSLIDSLKFNSSIPVVPHLTSILTMSPIYDLGISIKTGQKGDNSRNSSSNEINDALSQVFKGVNGFIKFAKQHPKEIKLDSKVSAIIPVIFTTANLFTSDINLLESNLEKGDVPKHTITPTDFILLRYPVSESFLTQPSIITAKSIGEVFDEIYMRTVIIVSTKGLSKLLVEELDIETIA